MTRTQGLGLISTKLLKIAQVASDYPDVALTTVAHHIDIGWLRLAYQRTRKDGAVGVDGQTAAMYEQQLEKNLSSLLDRFKSGRYRAPPVKRVYIPKSDGKKRPIGIPTLEDKVLQRAVLMVLEPIYEQTFKDCSFGFRRGRSAHQAQERLWRSMMGLRDVWLIELDIQSFFDHVNHHHLHDMLAHRVADGVIHRVIGKWLNAGIMEDGLRSQSTSGTPQGGVISPLLANLYLHEVLDEWFYDIVSPRLKGRSFLVRFADDAVMGFEHESDARRVLAALYKRFARFDLTLHPKKTRLLHLPRPDRAHVRAQDRSFDFLGFTHFWALSRKGSWIIRRKTSSVRLSRSLIAIADWCRWHRHFPVAWQHRQLSLKLRGHYAYFGITGNAQSLGRFLHCVERIWFKWLNRRSNRSGVGWDRFAPFLRRSPLPSPRVVHSVYHRRVSS
jgi:RNA-directed DNA polymerase